MVKRRPQRFFRYIKKAGRMIAYLVLFFIGLILLITLWYYTSCPVYTFSPPNPFKGDSLYNPYMNISEKKWWKGNFQVQSRAWGGITSGRGNSNEKIEKIYSSLGYDIIATSDYQRINRFGIRKPSYIPTYEHGYGIHKTHQICLGSQKVLWRDYPFYQGLNHKQHILNCLGIQNEIIAIAHPDLRDGYLKEEMKYLSGYHLMEVFNRARTSLAHWDSALSSGYPAFLLANDDAHNVTNPYEIGRYATFVQSDTLVARHILEALKKGRAYGVRIAYKEGETLEEKKLHALRLPSLKEVSFSNDTLKIKVSPSASEFRFVGQNGVILKNVKETNFAYYVIKPSDTYIRTEISFPSQDIIFLNPICRYQGGKITWPIRYIINQQASFIHYILWGSGGLILLFMSGLLIKKHHFRKAHENQ